MDTNDRTPESKSRTQGTTPVLKETEKLSVVPVMDREPSTTPLKSRLPENELQSGSVTLTGNETGVQPSGGKTVTQELSIGPVAQEKEATVQMLGDPSPTISNTRETGVSSGNVVDGVMEAVPDTEKVSESACDTRENRSTEKLVPHKRRYVSHKSMTDPLKMDMSNPVDMHLTSSQLSLQCFECHIIFSDHKSKERHLKLNHPAEYEHCILRNSLFACYVCDQHFTNSTELMAHQKAHVEKKPFKCQICGQAFKKTSELTVHKKIHFGEDGYACTDCGKPCKTFTLLKYHRRTHTGERPYVCRECGRRFSMPKALQKHENVHERGGSAHTKPRKQYKKTSTPTVKYPCSVCKATFKTPKTRLYHIKTQHNLLPSETSMAVSETRHTVGQQVRQCTPTITPISICQSTLLQGEPIGPLQQVNANIDTEQIRKLIESMGNVQKVNQVVILGQVPQNALPLGLQQMPKLGESVNFNVNPSPIDMLKEVKETEQSMTVETEYVNNVCDPMEQTIILEPITPDGQLLNPPFSELSSYIVPADNIGLSLHPEQSETHEREMINPLTQSETCTIQSAPINQSVFEGEVGELQNPDQTVILELTTALTPTEELEQTEPVPQTKMSSSEEQTTDLEKTSGETVIDQQESSLMPTVHLEIAPLQTEQPDLPTCAFVQTDTYTETLESQRDSQTNLKGKADSQMQTAILESVPSVLDSVSIEETCEKSDQEQPKELLVDSRESQQNIDKMSTSEDSVAQEQTPSQLEIKHVQQASQSSVNVMSAQELVKIRKRKPAKIFIFEDPIEQLIAKIKKYDKHFEEKPAKRQKKKKSRLVVKFGPKNKDKKNTRTQPCQVNQEDLSVNRTATILSEKKVAAKKTVTKTKIDKKANPVSPKIQTTVSLEPQVQICKENLRKKKKKKQKVLESVAVEQIQKQEDVSSPVVKKKKTKKRQPKRTTGKLTCKGRKKKLTNEQKRSAEASNVPAAVSGPQLTEDCLLLLKGHKQPQLKVYKLDPSKAPGQTQDISPQESPNNDPSKDTSTESSDMLTPAIKKKGGRPKKNQKARSLLSSLTVPDPPSETQPTKPKSTRKRKASWRVETEGVITSSSHSRRALECKECGETFSGVCALQQHKETMHIVESPGLTFTNGNIFEGVSNIDLCKTPKRTNNVVGEMTTVTEWDTEAEMGEMALDNRDCTVSFPALSPSPSLFVVGAESKGAAHRENHENTPMGVARGSVEQTRHKITEVLYSNSDKMRIIQSHGDSQPQTNDRVAGPLTSDGGPSIAQGSTDEDIKGDLLLEVDLITVGEPPVAEKDDPKNSLVGQSNLEGDGADTIVLADQIESAKTMERSTNSQTTSCFSQQCKEEEEEVLVQRKGEAVMAVGRSVVPGVRRRGARGRLRRCLVRPRSREAEEESGECQIVFEKPSEGVDSEVCLGGDTVVPDGPDKPAAAVACEPPSSEHAPVECASDGAVNAPAPEPVEAQGGESSQSPDIVLERFLTFRQTKACEEEQCQEGTRISHNQGSNFKLSRSVAEAEKIKVEENVSEPPLLNTNNESQHGMQIQVRKQGVRTILVKQESSLILSESQATGDSRHIRWNVEEMDVENPPETGTTEGNKPVFSAQQCVFYPVKEEQRETFLGATRRETTQQAVGVSSDTNLMESPSASGCQYDENPATEDYQEIRVTESMLSADISDQDSDQANPGEAREDSEHRELLDFLLRGSDEEDLDVPVFCDPPPDSEAQAMGFFSENPSSPPQPNGVLHKEPIEYFSSYFGWDTWEEFSQSTNKMSILSEPVTAKEVAQYVGIHIAMGTLKFPSLKLYWQDLTKVPMIAEAMTLSRFFQLSGKLKLASPEKEPNTCRDDISEMDTEHAVDTAPSTVSNGSNNDNNIIFPQGNDGQNLGDKPDEQNTQTEPLWRVQRLLRRFQAGCLLPTCESDYGVDQYSFPLTAGNNNKHSLHCTTLIGLNGLILHLGLNSDLSDKEAAVERLVPKGSVAFLCKQELSTPAMLERLLEAGAHGAGRVGGARGQVGDEFVSADGQLKLRRSHCGFVLSTVGSGQRNMASLIDNLEKAQISARLRRDLHDLYRIPLTASSAAAWPQAVLWRLTDLALVNSWLQYRRDRGSLPEPLTLMAFRLEVAKALIFSSGSDTQDSRLPAQPQSVESQAVSADTLQGGPLPDASIRYDGSGHWPEQPEHGEGGRCRLDGCGRTSRVLCLKCCVFLCISRNHNCFLKFHNQESSGTQF